MPVTLLLLTWAVSVLILVHQLFQRYRTGRITRRGLTWRLGLMIYLLWQLAQYTNSH